MPAARTLDIDNVDFAFDDHGMQIAGMDGRSCDPDPDLAGKSGDASR